MKTHQKTDSPVTNYQDNFLARLCIAVMIHKLSQAAEQPAQSGGYEGLVNLSKAIVGDRTAKQQQAVVNRMFHSLIPGFVLAGIRKFFPPNRLYYELQAWFATKLCAWLVGPCEVIDAEVTDAAGQVHQQRSGVQIQKCRYLEQSRCVGMCINLCKLPTQQFFTEEFGFPLTLTPDFDDLSCKMVFGQVPPPLETEAAYQQPCFATECVTAASRAPACPKVREA